MSSNIMLFKASFFNRDLIICALSVQYEFLYITAKGAVWVVSGSALHVAMNHWLALSSQPQTQGDYGWRKRM